MRAFAVSVALFAGCAIEHPRLPDPSPAIEPTTCAVSASLDGSGLTTPTPRGPFAVDTNGVALCLHLGATANARVQFVGLTAYEPGPASSFVMTLEDAARAPIVDSTDVSVNNQSFSSLGWVPPLGVASDVVVWLRGQPGLVGTATTMLTVALIDPLE